MKVLSLIMLFVASMAFVLVGCNDNSSPLLAPTEKALSNATTPSALAKGGPVVHSASGNCGIFFEGKNVTFAFTANKYADGSCSGEYQIYTHSQDPAWGKWHGKVVSLEIHDGNKAVIGGVETHSGFPGYFDTFVVIDNGEGKNATPDMWTSTVYWSETQSDPPVWSLPPDQVYNKIIEEQLSMGYVVTVGDFLIPIQHGNIQVR
jgi:hypothetical protein